MSIFERVWNFFNACRDVEGCEMVIKAYADSGISGSLPDMEHKDMLEEALARRHRLLVEIYNEIGPTPPAPRNARTGRGG